MNENIFELKFRNGDFVTHNSKTGNLEIRVTGDIYIDSGKGRHKIFLNS